MTALMPYYVLCCSCLMEDGSGTAMMYCMNDQVAVLLDLKPAEWEDLKMLVMKEEDGEIHCNLVCKYSYNSGEK